MSSAQIAIFGEVLFDRFDDGSQVLGGAPFNVAWHLQALGLAPNFVSCVGDDESGRLIIQQMQHWGLSTDAVSVDPDKPTGAVTVSVVNGEPSYCIEDQQAYDAIPTVNLMDVGTIYHGSLALRHTANRQALAVLRQSSNAKLFMDVNLRAPWWQLSDLQHWLSEADWVKLNEQELHLLQPDVAGDLWQRMLVFQRQYQLQGLIVTLGELGAWACCGEERVQVQPETCIEVADTVGAGDAFAAVCLLGLQHDWPLAITLSRAQQLASEIVVRRGATINDVSVYQRLLSAW